MILASVKTDGLLELIWVAPLAVLFVALSWSLCVLAVTRMSEHRRGGNGSAAFGYSVLSALGIAAFVGIVVLALWVIING